MPETEWFLLVAGEGEIPLEEALSRTARLVGEEGLRRLASARVALLGLGGVGGSCAEALCRAGVGDLLLCDNDDVDETNLNRQAVAARSTLGIAKTEAMAARLGDLRPAVRLTLERRFYLPDTSAFLYDFSPDIVLDAIDTVTAKLHLAEECARRGIPLVSCLGTGNRLYPQLLRVGDIADTASTGCPLARVMRRELRRRGVGRLRVVYSAEQAIRPAPAQEENGRHPPGSSPFVPPAAGLILAAEAVRILLGFPEPPQ